MTRKPTRKDHITAASKAHCDLNIFYAIIAILEGGTISTPSHQAAERIIAICKNESGKCLWRMDTAVARALKP